MERTINGKKVVFREKLAARGCWNLLEKIDHFGQEAVKGDFTNAAIILTRAVESWEFPGDPTDLAAYDALDQIEEMPPLIGALTEYIALKTERLGGKNLPGLSTSESASSNPSPGTTGE